jgi:hypothetical protein
MSDDPEDKSGTSGSDGDRASDSLTDNATSTDNPALGGGVNPDDEAAQREAGDAAPGSPEPTQEPAAALERPAGTAADAAASSTNAATQAPPASGVNDIRGATGGGGGRGGNGGSGVDKRGADAEGGANGGKEGAAGGGGGHGGNGGSGNGGQGGNGGRRGTGGASDEDSAESSGGASSQDSRHPEYPPYSAFYVNDSSIPGFLEYGTRPEWEERTVPIDQVKLLFEFDEVCAVLRERFKPVGSCEFKAEFERLQNLVQATFGSTIARLEAGRLALEAYKQELIQREGAAIKNGYLKELARAATKASVWIVIVSVLLTAILSSGNNACLTGTAFSTVVHGLTISDKPVNPALALYFALFLVSTMWGVWLSFSVRSIKLAFSQLQHVEEDMLKPWARLLTVGLLAFVLLVLFYLKAFEFKIGETASTEHIFDNVLVSMFAGLSFGFIDKLLPTQVGQKMKQFATGAKS